MHLSSRMETEDPDLLCRCSQAMHAVLVGGAGGAGGGCLCRLALVPTHAHAMHVLVHACTAPRPCMLYWFGRGGGGWMLMPSCTCTHPHTCHACTGACMHLNPYKGSNLKPLQTLGENRIFRYCLMFLWFRRNTFARKICDAYWSKM